MLNRQLSRLNPNIFIWPILASRTVEIQRPVTVSLPGYVKTEAHKEAGLEHLNKSTSWMWVDAKRVVLKLKTPHGQVNQVFRIIYS